MGRFNQRHTAEHKMELCRPRLTSLHMLRAANPDLSFDQLMYLLELSAMREEDDDDEEEENRGGGAGGGGVVGGGINTSIAQARLPETVSAAAAAAAAGGEVALRAETARMYQEGILEGDIAVDGQNEAAGARENAAAAGESEEGGGGDDDVQLEETLEEESEPEIAMPRGRGPRPVIVPSAEWPSPSAAAPPLDSSELQQPPAQ